MLHARLSRLKRRLALTITLMLLIIIAPVASAQEGVAVACPDHLAEFEVRLDGTYQPVGDPMGVTLTDTAENYFTFESTVPIAFVVVSSLDEGVTQEFTTFRYEPPTMGPETVSESSILSARFCAGEGDVQAGGDTQTGDTDTDTAVDTAQDDQQGDDTHNDVRGDQQGEMPEEMPDTGAGGLAPGAAVPWGSLGLAASGLLAAGYAVLRRR